MKKALYITIVLFSFVLLIGFFLNRMVSTMTRTIEINDGNFKYESTLSTQPKPIGIPKVITNNYGQIEDECCVVTTAQNPQPSFIKSMYEYIKEIMSFVSMVFGLLMAIKEFRKDPKG